MTYKTYFKDKKHYQDFIAAWSRAVNSPKAKPRIEPCDEFIRIPLHSEYKCSEGTGTIRISGWINVEHHLLYNIFRNVEWNRGFAKYTNNRRFYRYGGDLPDGGRYETALDTLKWWKQLAERVIEERKTIPTLRGRTKEFRIRSLNHTIGTLNLHLAPFDDTITIEMLARLDLTNEKLSNYDK